MNDNADEKALDSLERKFHYLSLDEQFDFLEYFKPKAERLKDKRGESAVQLSNYLETQMFKNLDDWLRLEMSE